MLRESSLIHWVVLLAFGVYLSWALILGSDANYPIHDNLDSLVTAFKVASMPEVWLKGPGANIDVFFGEMERAFLPSPFFMPVMLNKLFNPDSVLIGVYLSQKLMAFFGAIIFCNTFLPSRYVRNNLGLIWLSAFAFATLNFFIWSFSSIAGLPLFVVAAFYITHRRSSIRNFHWIIYVIFYWMTQLTPIFAPFLLGALAVNCIFNFNFQSRRFTCFLFVLSCFIFCLIEYNLIYATIFLESHRSNVTPHFNSFFMEIFSGLRQGSYENFTLRNKYLIGGIIIWIFILFLDISDRRAKWLLILFACLFFFGSLFGKIISFIIQQVPYLDVISSFQFERLGALSGFIFLVWIALAVRYLSDKRGLYVLVIFVIIFNFKGHPFLRNSSEPTVKSFFSENLLSNRVKPALFPDGVDGKVAALGFHPSVLHFNGFETLDGYWVSYPKKYHAKFERLIADEVKNCPQLQDYFSNWGNRAYLFSCSLWQDAAYVLNRKQKPFVLKDYRIDTNLFIEMGGKFIISSVEVDTENVLGLRLRGKFTDPESDFDFFVYEVFRLPRSVFEEFWANKSDEVVEDFECRRN